MLLFINKNVNVITQAEFELANFVATSKYVTHDVIETSPEKLDICDYLYWNIGKVLIIYNHRQYKQLFPNGKFAVKPIQKKNEKK